MKTIKDAGGRLHLSARNQQPGPVVHTPDDLNLSRHLSLILSVLRMAIESSSKEGEEIEVKVGMNRVGSIGEQAGYWG